MKATPIYSIGLGCFSEPTGLEILKYLDEFLPTPFVAGGWKSWEKGWLPQNLQPAFSWQEFWTVSTKILLHRFQNGTNKEVETYHGTFTFFKCYFCLKFGILKMKPNDSCPSSSPFSTMIHWAQTSLKTKFKLLSYYGWYFVMWKKNWCLQICSVFSLNTPKMVK